MLISHNTCKPGRHVSNTGRGTCRVYSSKVFSTLLVVLFFSVGLSINPVPAHAGIFSFVAGLFGVGNGALVVDLSIAENSQNMALLQPALNIDPNPSKGGGDITIVGDTALLPDSGPLGTMADLEDSHSTDQISIYVVRQGDTISQIAKMFDVSVNTIIWANNLTSSTAIKEGQTLVILPVSGVKYTVKKGDTLPSIAKQFKGDAEEIGHFNDIPDSSYLIVGQEIIIPDGEVVSVVASRSTFTPARLHNVGGPAYAGYYIRPIPGPLTQGLHGYNGIDLGGPRGTPIVSAASGVVIVSRSTGWNGGYGSYVVIDHPNGTQTLYAHMSSDIVSVGMPVVQGQVIGYVGSTGRATGPHLHFEVRGAANPFAR